MRRFIELGILGFLCSFHLGITHQQPLYLFALLSLSLGLGLIMAGRGWLVLVLNLVFLAAVFGWPAFGYYLPVLIYANYDWFGSRYYKIGFGLERSADFSSQLRVDSNPFDGFFLIGLVGTGNLVGLIVHHQWFTLAIVGLGLYLGYRSLAEKRSHSWIINQYDNLKEGFISLEKYNQQLQIASDRDKEIAVLAERDRIARGLHDSIGHTISSSLIQLESISLMNQEPELNQELVILHTTLDKGMDEIRAYLHDLHNSAYNPEIEINKMLAHLKGWQIKFNYSLAEATDAGIKQDLIAMMKIILANTMKHSKSDQINISITSNRRYHILAVSDNGPAVNGKIKEGIGFYNIRRIVEKYGGQFHYNFTNGCHINVYIPVELTDIVQNSDGPTHSKSGKSRNWIDRHTVKTVKAEAGWTDTQQKR